MSVIAPAVAADDHKRPGTSGREAAATFLPSRTALRRRLFNPPNAVVDHGIRMKNGWPVKATMRPSPPAIPVVKIAPEPLPPAHEQLTSTEVVPVTPNAPHTSTQRIIRATAGAFKMRVDFIMGPSRRKDIVLARQVAMWLVRELTDNSMPSIGRRFGGRDHTTVLHAVRKIGHMLAMDPDFRQRVEILRAALEPPAEQEAA